jgi:phospholipase A-2-activating protein
LSQWDNTSNQWQKIGEVVDAVGSGRRQLYDGKEYDYVFDVDIQDGVPPLKLPYNANGTYNHAVARVGSGCDTLPIENPYSAAQRFLEKNDLPLSYIDQVVQFIEKNTGGINLGGNEEFVDPFTGEFSYGSPCIV